MRKLLLVCVLSLPCTSIAQNNSSSWTNLSSLPSGKKIQIVDTSSKKYSATFINASDASIAFVPKNSAQQQTLQSAEVRTVKVSSGKRRLINTLVVGGIGAGIGAVVFAAQDSGCTPGPTQWCIFSLTRGQAAGIGAVFGAVPGMAIGAFLPARTTVYSVSK
jgi:hypothetical protein